MKRMFLRSLVALCCALAGVIAYEFTASARVDFWKTVDGARVTFDGRESPNSHLYRRNDGVMLFNTADDGSWYLEGGPGEFSYCDSYLFHEESLHFISMHLPGYFYVWHRSAYPCLMPGKVDAKPGLIRQEHSIEFNSLANNRIRISW